MITTNFLVFFILNFVIVKSSRYDTFIGWRGATYDPKVVWGDDNQEISNQNNESNTKSLSNKSGHWIQVISHNPRVFYFHNFATKEECNAIRKLAAPWVKRSTVLSQDNKDEISNIRTSYGTFVKRLSDPVIIDISDRIAMWSHIPPINQEDIQVLKYTEGQKYSLHGDVFQNNENNYRIATAIIYLSDVEEGGETAFPGFDTEWYEDGIKDQFGEFSKCAQKGIAVKPKMGDAILFFNMDNERNEDVNAWHTGCPVIKGIKWTATIWIHEEPFRPETYLESNKEEKRIDPGICNDWHMRCKSWSQNGECDKNKGYMHEICRLSCNLCTPCDDNDDGECYRSNRIAGGYLNIEDFK